MCKRPILLLTKTDTALGRQYRSCCFAVSLRNNAACCIHLRDLRYLRENNTQEDSNYCTMKRPMSLADLADLRRQKTDWSNESAKADAIDSDEKDSCDTAEE